MLKLPFSFAVLAFAATLSAHADSYSFNISTGASSQSSPAATFTASGTLSGAVNSGLPAIDLTGVTGYAQTYTFTGVIPVGSSTPFSFDNVVYTDPNARHVDATGVGLFLTPDGYPTNSTLAHVYDTPDGYMVDIYDLAESPDATPFKIETFDLTPASVPEPSTLALLGTGALGLAGTLRRKLIR